MSNIQLVKQLSFKVNVRCLIPGLRPKWSFKVRIRHRESWEMNDPETAPETKNVVIFVGNRPKKKRIQRI